MLFYLYITLIVDVAFILINLGINQLIYNLSVVYVVFAILLGTIIVYLIDFIIFGLICALPNKWFEKELNFYKANEQQKQIYEKLGIKGKDWSSMGARILTKKKKAFWAHIFAAIFGFFIILIFPIEYWFIISVPIALMNFVLNGIPIMSIKYNFQTTR